MITEVQITEVSASRATEIYGVTLIVADGSGKFTEVILVNQNGKWFATSKSSLTRDKLRQVFENILEVIEIAR